AFGDGDVLEKVKAGAWIVHSVTANTQNHEWVDVLYSISDEAGSAPRKLRVSAYARITYSPRQDWAIRESHSVSGPPFDLEAHETIALVQLSSDGYLARKYTAVVADVSSLAGAKELVMNRMSDDRAWKQRTEYELDEVETGPLQKGLFSLAALGVDGRA